MGVRITFLGGAAELGGNIFLLEDNGVRFFLDFGVNFDRLGAFYRFPIGPRKYRALLTHLKLGLYPHFPGIYRPDYLRALYKDPEYKKFGFKPHDEVSIDGIVLSHAHVDHCAGIHFMDPRLPIYTSRLSKMIMLNMQETGGMPFNEFVDFFYYDAEVLKLREKGKKILTRADEDMITIERDFRIFTPGKPFNIGHVRIEPYNVDHSLPGACAFIIHTSIGPVAFTGDIRLRGYHRRWTEDFIEAARDANLRYFLTEGSLIHKVHAGTEEEIWKSMKKRLKDVPGLIMTSYPPRDFDRLKTMYRIAKSLKRRLVIDARQADLMKRLEGELGDPQLHSQVIRIYDREKRQYSGWEKDLLFANKRKMIRKKNVITADGINNNQQEFILYLQASSMDELLKLKPDPGSVYFRSHPEPYTPEMEIDQTILVNWMRQMGVEYCSDTPLLDGDLDYKVMQAHTTGHMSEEEKTEMVQIVLGRKGPGVLVPIHVLRQERDRFKKMYDGQIEYVDLGDTLELNAA